MNFIDSATNLPAETKSVTVSPRHFVILAICWQSETSVQTTDHRTTQEELLLVVAYSR